MKSGSSIVKTALNEALEKTPQPMGPPSKKEKEYIKGEQSINQTQSSIPGKDRPDRSIKINKSSVDKMTRYAVENKSVSRQGRRSGSRDKGESSSWTDSEDDIEKKRRGDSCHWGEKGFNCQSKKYSNNSAQARKVDSI